MDHQFTEKLQQWMNTPDSQKDWDEGAIMLLQLSGNKIMYANVSVNPKGKAEFIKGKLQQYLNFRLQNLTREEVKEMQSKVDVIVKEVIKPAEENGFADFKAGKRADHDTLPDEVKVLYAENLDIVHRMRELHLKLRTLSLENATCPDSERYPVYIINCIQAYNPYKILSFERIAGSRLYKMLFLCLLFSYRPV